MFDVRLEAHQDDRMVDKLASEQLADDGDAGAAFGEGAGRAYGVRLDPYSHP
jgi:hypothetical protein